MSAFTVAVTLLTNSVMASECSPLLRRQHIQLWDNSVTLFWINITKKLEKGHKRIYII